MRGSSRPHCIRFSGSWVQTPLRMRKMGLSLHLSWKRVRSSGSVLGSTRYSARSCRLCASPVMARDLPSGVRPQASLIGSNRRTSAGRRRHSLMSSAWSCTRSGAYPEQSKREATR